MYSCGTVWADAGPTLFCIRGFLLGSLDQPYGGVAPTDWTADFEARRITDLVVIFPFCHVVFQNDPFRIYAGLGSALTLWLFDISQPRCMHATGNLGT